MWDICHCQIYQCNLTKLRQHIPGISKEKKQPTYISKFLHRISAVIVNWSLCSWGREDGVPTPARSWLTTHQCSQLCTKELFSLSDKFLYSPLVCSVRVAHSFYQKFLQSDVSKPVCKHHLMAQGLSALNLHWIPATYSCPCTALF